MQNGDVLQNRYEIIEYIGKGGLGMIYLADDRHLGQLVVIKKIREDYKGRLDCRTEVDILKKLNHTYLPKVLDFVQEGTQIYTVMDYIEGRDFKYWLDHGYRFEEKDLIKWLGQLLEVLAYLHAQEPPVIHSDIKPANIMLKPNGDICLIDFNISLNNEQGIIISGVSKGYASPEQYRQFGLAARQTVMLDARSDIYSVGATFYHMLSGIMPDSEYERIIPADQLKLPQSDGLVTVIKKAMQFRPSARYRSAQRMLAAVKNIRKLDKRYRQIKYLMFLTAAGYISLMTLSVMALGFGVSGKRTEAFVEAFQTLQSGKGYDRASEARSAMVILNDTAYSHTLTKNPEYKAELLYIIGTHYEEMRDYEMASSYYREAMMSDPSTGDYARALAVVLARSGNTQEAMIVMNSGHVDLDVFDQWLIQAELAIWDEEADMAVQYLEQIVSAYTGPEVRYRACMLLADLYGSQGNYLDAAWILEGERSQNADTYILRRLAGFYMEAGQNADQSTDQLALWRSAVDVYEQLLAEGKASYTDQLNLALAYQYAAEHFQSEKILKEMLETYPDDYKIYMRLSLVCTDAEGRKSVERRKYEKAWNYYKEAARLYETYLASGSQDAEMEELLQLMETLQAQGWIHHK